MTRPTIASERPGWLDGIEPTPDIELADWSDDHRVLNQKSSAEPGRWRTDRTPYWREPMNCLSHHCLVREVSVMKGAQIGGTEFGNNWIAYTVDHAPGPTLSVQPSVDLAKLWSRQRFAPMVGDMECLREKIADSRSRDSGNTVLLKEYPGGLLRIAGANSAAPLRAMPVKNLMLDEIDAYPQDVDGEGDPVELAENRTKTFSRCKKLKISTPTVEEVSRIERSYNDGSKAKYQVPCPDCGTRQVIEFDNLHYHTDDAGKVVPGSVKLACIECGVLIDEGSKTEMMRRGEWVHLEPDNPHKSYQISSLYSPLGWESWETIVVKYVAAADNEELMKTFVNTRLGLPYKGKSKKLADSELKKRAEDYPLGIAPLGALALTAGVDVQDNRLEVYVYGYGQRERWPVDFNVIMGSPGANETWQQLDDYLFAPFDHAAGTELTISATAIDSGGHFTQQVYNYCRLRKTRNVFAVKGSSQRNKPILGKPTAVDVTIHGKTLKNSAEVWPVGTDTAKDAIYQALELTDPAADGYFHFSTELPDDYYKQLTAETKTHRYVKGFPVYEWVLPKGKRNEALDCTVYADAAFYKLGLHRWRRSQWEQLEQRVQPATDDLFASAHRAEAETERADQVEEIAPKKRKKAKRPGRRKMKPGDRLLNG